MKALALLLFSCLIFANSFAQKIEFFPKNDLKLSFAESEIKPYLGKYQIELIADAARVGQVCADNQLTKPKWDGDQAYALRRQGNKVWVLASDAVGAMYGGLDVAEALRTGHPEWLDSKDQKPYLPERGLKFNWLWRTYGEGINDGLRAAPREDFRLIHRWHETGLDDILTSFKGLNCRLDLSIKYAIAHMYAIPNPPFTLPAFNLLTEKNKSWLTIRNDDIYSMR